MPVTGTHPCWEGGGLAQPGQAGCQARWSGPAPRPWWAPEYPSKPGPHSNREGPTLT